MHERNSYTTKAKLQACSYMWDVTEEETDDVSRDVLGVSPTMSLFCMSMTKSLSDE